MNPEMYAGAAVDRMKAAVLRETSRLALLYPRVHAEAERYAALPPLPAALSELQRDRLSAILCHAGLAVPFYRDRVDASAAGRAPFEELTRLPLVDKATLRGSLLDLCDDDLDPATCFYAVTSGTTGVPVKVILDDSHMVHMHALAWRRYRDEGVPEHFKMLMPFQNWLGEGWFEYTSALLALARMAEFGLAEDASPAQETEALQRIAHFAPDVVFGHPSCCVRLARAAIGRGVPLRPSLVATFGERLLPAARAYLGEVFAAPVRDSYGLREVGTVATQCAQGTYHVESERLWVEIVNDDGDPVPDGTAGEIVVTNLVNRTQPLLRYRTGDVGSLGTERCACGSPRKAMLLLEGRNVGGVRLPDGRVVELNRLGRVVRARPVERFQVVQREPADVEVRILPVGELTPADLTALADELADACDHTIRPAVLVVTEDGFLRHGMRKHVDIVSHLDQAQATGVGIAT